MNKLFTLVALACGCSLSIAGAATTNVQGNNLDIGGFPGTANVITDQFGTPIPNGSGIASLGYFGSLSDAQVTTLAAGGNFSSLIADFVGLANATFGSHGSVANADGFYETSQTGLSALAYDTHGDKSMYSFYADTLTLAAANELGLYRHDDTIPTVDPQPSFDQYNLDNHSSTNDGSIVIGTAGTNNYDFSALGGGVIPINSMALAPVPEPSASLLALIGIAGFLRRRR